ncbi:MAG: methyl-accepting chemotaxis protein [Treponema sp.]|jgi:iron only hydrogenase large subunit-like protein/uncharacterized protein YukE|nr:methyl-accepting chemotaxis protein [Treponema sp.]
MAAMVLTPVIKIDEEKCINCYTCITACPVKYCMNGSGNKLLINPDLCIGCGNCIAACTHKARLPVDDTSHFFGDLKGGDKMIAIVAPAIASVFPGKFLNVNGYLKSLGVEAVFDVSLGAELTVISYLDFIKQKKPRMVIAQPCPAIVNYIETYQPKLIPFLAPADSPMLHTIKMVKEFYPQYKNHKIVAISPCLAKRREFDETGLGDYNVTMFALKEYFKVNKIDLASYPAEEYLGPSAERAVRFSSPGGLVDTAERFMPGIRRRSRRIEGVHSIYPYLEEMAELLDTDIMLSPLVDCLNCEKGCNGGPGTGNSEKSLHILEDPVVVRSAKLEAYHAGEKGVWIYKKKYQKVLTKYWKAGLYNRSYRDLSGNNFLKKPSETELTETYKILRKFTQKDIFDCTSCGYGSCKSMAVAIFNKQNKPENCAHYNVTMLEEQKKHIGDLNVKLEDHVKVALNLIEGVDTLESELNHRVDSLTMAVNESSVVTEKMVDSLKTTSAHFQGKQESIKDLIDNTAKSQESMRETIQSVQGIAQSVDGIGSTIKIISAIAANTNLLSMNAAIEAAHAGEAGRGFAVVANEIRRLSETTRENSRNISQTLSNIIAGINVTSKRSGETNNLIKDMSKEIDTFAATMTGLIQTLSELSAGSSEITATLVTLRELTSAIKTSYAEVLTMMTKLRDDMNDLAAVAKET